MKCLSPLGNSSTSLDKSVSDLWGGIVSHESHVSELKNWMRKQSKKPCVGVELRAGGDLHEPEKPG